MAVEERTLNIDVRFEPEDQVFIAEVRELQGCIAMGSDLPGLQASLQSAITDYLSIFEQREVVEVSPMVDVAGTVDVVPAIGRHSAVRVLAGC